jgi:Flp pilus assembly pilin Flp
MKHKHSTVKKTGLRGAVMVEYALLLLLVALPMISAFVLVGKQMFKDYRAAQVAILSSKP